MPLFNLAPASLCILRLSAIGDCVHAVAMVQAIQRQWPTTQITWIMGKPEASLLRDLPGVEIIVFDAKAGWRSYLQLWQQLKQRHFDALLHLQNAFKASIASLGIRATYRLGFDHQRTSDCQRLFINHTVPSPQGLHVLDGFMAFACELGITDITPQWHIPLGEQDIQWAKDQLQTHRPSLIIAAGASKSYKNWTPSGYAAIADDAAQKGFQVILTGGPTALEHTLAEQIMMQCQHQPLNLTGKSSLKQLAALIQQVSAVVAPDTGAVHIATAMGTPVLGLYAHHNPQRVGPYFNQQHIVSVYDQCIMHETGRKPIELKWRARVKDLHAMEKIHADVVIQQFQDLCHTHHLLKQE